MGGLAALSSHKSTTDQYDTGSITLRYYDIDAIRIEVVVDCMCEAKEEFQPDLVTRVFMYGIVHQSPRTNRGYAGVLPYAHGCAAFCGRAHRPAGGLRYLQVDLLRTAAPGSGYRACA